MPVVVNSSVARIHITGSPGIHSWRRRSSGHTVGSRKSRGGITSSRLFVSSWAVTRATCHAARGCSNCAMTCPATTDMGRPTAGASSLAASMNAMAIRPVASTTGCHSIGKTLLTIGVTDR